MPIIGKQPAIDVDTIIVGAGIIGSTLYKALTAQGRECLLIDDKRLLGGTKPSGGHLKPSWFGDLKKADYEPAMELLDQLWGMHQSDFTVWPTQIKTTVYRIDTDVVVATPFTHGTVTSILDRKGSPVVTYTNHQGNAVVSRCGMLIMAAGAWCSELFPQLKIAAKRGVSFRFKGKLEQEFIKPWAPFKQVVAHQQGPEEIWVGDGSAILAQNWTDDRTQQCKTRCYGAIGASKKLIKTLTGIRPYCESGKDPCYLNQIEKNIWIVTGAGKSGTISAGWAANKIIAATN